MKLTKFIELSGMSASLFAKKIGAKSRMTVKRYLDGTRIPTESYLAKIETTTKGLVTAKDFIAEAEERKRTEQTIRINKRIRALRVPTNAHEESKSIERTVCGCGECPHPHNDKQNKETLTAYDFSHSTKKDRHTQFIKTLLQGLEGADLESKEFEVLETLREDGDFDDAWASTRHLYKTNPLDEALSLLGKRVSFQNNGYLLDGRPASIPMLISLTNKLRRGAGLEPLPYPTICPINDRN